MFDFLKLRVSFLLLTFFLSLAISQAQAGYVILSSQPNNGLPEGFVYLEQIDPTIVQDIRYATSNNFTGHRLKGYDRARCIMTVEAALALAKVQRQLVKQSLGLKVFDAYRPQQAVYDFIRWSQNSQDERMKAAYFPRVDKRMLFALEYVAAKSAHTRGSTVDLTIIRLPSSGMLSMELEMGTHFDFLDELSHSLSKNVSIEAQRNRAFLREAMAKVGFQPTRTEWWHYSLTREPFPDTYFDFVVR